MKNIKYTFLGVIITLFLNSTFAQKSTGINNTSPNPKASLDISTSTTQGILIPRLPSSSKGTFGLTSSDKGMIFYGNDTDSIYYWTGNKWVSLALNGAASPSNYWSLSGNAPDSTVNYLGTNGFQPLILSTNGIQRMRISRNGNFGFNMNPNASVLMSIKSTGSGKVIQLEKSSGGTNLFEVREITTGEGEIDLYNASGVRQVQINAGSGDNLFVGSGNFGIGVVPSGTKFEVRSNGSTPSTLNLRLTNAATQTLFVVDDAGDVTIPGLVGPGVVTANASGLLSLVAGSPTTGTGVANKVAFWNGAGTMSYNTNFHWDNTNGYLGIGSAAPTYPLFVKGNSYLEPGILGSAPYKGTSWFSIQHTSLPLDDKSYGFAQHKGGYVILNTPPNAGTNYIDFRVGDVSQMRMSENGNLSIGTTAEAGRVYVYNSTTSTQNYGVQIDHLYAGTGIKYGIDNNVSTDGTGGKYGIRNSVYGNSAGSYNYGIYNYVDPQSTTTSYGLYNYISSTGTGTRYGIINYTYAGATSTSNTYNLYNYSSNSGTGTAYGIYQVGEDMNYISSNIGIGTISPTLAALQVEKMVGNTVSIFKNTGNSAGISLVADWPGVYFNSYFNVTAKSMSTNAYAGMINFEPSTGDITFSAATTGGIANANLTFSEKMRIDATNGYVGIGTTAPSYPLDVNGDIRTNSQLFLTGSATYNLNVTGTIFQLIYGNTTANSSIEVNGYNTTLGAGFSGGGYRLTVGNSGDGSAARGNSWQTFSDKRLKENILPIENSLESILKINGVRFSWKSSHKNDIGFIAQDIENVFPEIVYTDPTEKDSIALKTVDYSRITPVLVEAIKQQQQLIENQKKTIDTIIKRVELLEKK